MKFKNICIYFLFTIVILLSFKLPDTFLKLDKNEFASIQSKKTLKQNKIDVETEKIYLVKTIHRIENNKTIEISTNSVEEYVVKNSSERYEGETETQKNLFNETCDQIRKLSEYDILEKIELNGNNKGIGFLLKMYRDDESTYIVNNIKITTDNREYTLDTENKTGKILYIDFNKDMICKKTSKKEILENYIKYLDLYIIDDWKYEEDITNNIYYLKSDKADLQASLIQVSKTNSADSKYILTIHATNFH